ncbi:MAG: fibronectin type III domain-containing protein [Candidatus Nanohalobium sp.]
MAEQKGSTITYSTDGWTTEDYPNTERGVVIEANTDLSSVEVTLMSNVSCSRVAIGDPSNPDAVRTGNFSGGETIHFDVSVSASFSKKIWVDGGSDSSYIYGYDQYGGPKSSSDFDVTASYYDGNTDSGSYATMYNFAAITAYTPVTAPSAPTSVSTSVQGNDKIDVSWSSVNWNGDQGNYRVQLSRDGASYTTPSGGNATPNSGTTSATYNPNSDNSYNSQVGIDSSFRFRVRAENSVGNSSWTYSGTVYTEPIPSHNPSVSRPDASTVSLSWSNKSSIESGVEVQRRDDTGSGYSAWSTVTTTSAGATSYSDSPPSDARFQYRLRTIAPDGGTSDWVYADYGNKGNLFFSDDFEDQDLAEWSSTSLSDSQSGIVSGGLPAGSVGGADEGTYYLRLDSTNSVTKNLGDLSSESDVIVKCAVAIESADGSSEYGKIQWYDGSSWSNLREIHNEYNRQGWVEIVEHVPASKLSTDNRLRFTGSTGGGDQFAVDRVVVSDVLHEFTKPAAPSGLSLDTSTEREITASWTDNASVNTKYETKIRPKGTSTWNHIDNLSANLNSYTFTGLLDGEKYETFVRATSEQARHGTVQSYYYTDSSTVSGTTILPSPGIDTASVIDNNNKITASWTDNSNNEDGFRLMLSTDGGSTFSQQGSDISANSTSFTTSELLFNQDYQAKVRAFTEHTSSDSNTVSLKTGYGLQYYNSSFTPGTVKVYDGSNWVRPFKVKRFDGSQWD